MLGITVLGSGSSGNSIIIHGREGDILVDAGFSLKELRKRMAAAEVEERRLRAILVTHEHGDHAKGVGVASRGLGLPVYTTPATARMLAPKKRIGEDVVLFNAGQTFTVGEFEVQPFSIPHDAVDPVGFTFTVPGFKLGVATDIGYPSSVICHHLGECDILLLESNHDLTMLRQSDRPWRLKQRIMGRQGHLNNTDSLMLLKRVLHTKTRHLIIGHTSRECNTYELVEALAAQSLVDLGRADVILKIARQETHLPTIWVS